MPHNRFYFPETLKVSQIITLKDDELKHLKVMRLDVKDSCEIVNGKQQLAIAEVKSIEKTQTVLEIKQVRKKNPPTTNILCIAFLKAKKLELILEKATELSITEFWIYKAEKSEVNEIKKNQIERFKKILISALKQCGRFDLPKINFHESVQAMPKFKGLNFYGDVAEKAPAFYNQLKDAQPKLILIGPEAGFSKKEIDYFQKSDFLGVRLSDFVLRAETAAIAAATLMSHASMKD